MILLSPMSQGDIPKLTRLEAQTTPFSWTEKMLSDSWENAAADCFVIEHKQNTVGYLVVQSVLDESELLNIVVFKSFQSRGYAQAALKRLCQSLQDTGSVKLFLEVRASNVSALNLYRKFTFKQQSVRKDYYRAKNDTEAEDALLMYLNLGVFINS
ncbi:MAG: ribosomal protein S18-alanine N-acetyltransferase [Arenicellales bacterium]